MKGERFDQLSKRKLPNTGTLLYVVFLLNASWVSVIYWSGFQLIYNSFIYPFINTPNTSRADPSGRAV
jgi:hypothetical protein